MTSKGSNLKSQLEDLNITRDELDQIGEALKKEDFRKLLNNYFEEVTNPENQKVYENEITQLEKERGVDVTFIHPAAGYVIKTSVDGKKKAFINICQNENIGKPVAKRETGGVRWSVPYSQAPPRDDFDKNKNFCVVYDVVFHPETIRMAHSNKSFKQLVNDTAMNAIEESFKVVLDKKNLIYPKIPFKGMKRPTVIRKKSKCPPTPSEDSDQGIFDLPNYPYPEPPEEVVPKCSELPTTKDESPYTVPKYIIKQRSTIEMQDFTNSMTSKMNAAIPSALVVEIDLPLIKSAVDVNLDVSEKCLSLSSEKPAKYKLDINLPYAIVEGEGNAKFDSRTKKLVVTLSVKRRLSNPSLSREDSGVDSESRSTESSSDDELHAKSDQQKIVEVLNTKTVDEIPSNAYRTNSVEQFLSSDVSYSLPSYKCNTVDNLLVFTFHVKNVEPESVDHVFLQGSCGLHLKFKSMGAGCFPAHYAFCVKFPGQLTVDADSLSIEVWDNNVIAQLRLIGCDNTTLTDYLCGKSKEELEKKAFEMPVAVLKLAEESKLTDEKGDIKVEVLKNEKELKSLKVTHTTKLSAVQTANESVENKVQIDDKSTEKAIKDEILSKTPILSTSSDSTKCDEVLEKTEIDSKEGKKCDKVSKILESNSKEAKKCDEVSEKLESNSKEVKKCDETSRKSEAGERKGSKKCDKSSAKSEKRKEADKCDETTVNSESDESKAVEKCDKSVENSAPVPILKYDGKGSPVKKCTFSDRPPLVHALSESLNDGDESMKPRFRGILKVGRSLSESNVDDYHWSEDGGEGVEKVKKTVRFNNAISKHLFRRNSCILDQRKKNQRKSRNKKRAQQRRASESENSECEGDKNDHLDAIVALKSDDETASETSETQSESDDGQKSTTNTDNEMSLSRRHPHKKGKKKSARKSASTAKMHFSNNLMFELDD